MIREFEYHRCPACGRRTACWVPFRADGSDVKIRRHADPRLRVICAASNQLLGEYQPKAYVDLPERKH